MMMRIDCVNFTNISPNISTSTSPTSAEPSSLSLADLEKALKLVQDHPRNKEWILIDPQGNAYKSEDVLLLVTKLMSHAKFEMYPGSMERILDTDIDDLYKK